MNIVGLIEKFAPDAISGYCYDADDPHRPVMLDIYVDNKLMDTRLANLRRPSAQKSKIPTTSCGFKFKLNGIAINPTKQNTRVCVRENSAVLGLHAFSRSQDELYPDTIEPELARRTQSYDRLIIVNHIPKTAGTSLRLALQKAVKKRNCTCHYPDMNYCDDHVWNWKFSPRATETFEEVLLSILEKKIRVLFGHFGEGNGGGLVEFLVCFPKATLITFLREPFQQAYSYFLHAKRSLGISEQFEDFMRQPQHQNIQSRHLENISLDRYSFVGIVENYSTSLKVMGDLLSHQISEKFVNAARARRDAAYNVNSLMNDDLLREFYALNQEDFKHYKAARARIENWGTGFGS